MPNRNLLQVLVVDDSEDSRHLISKLLRDAGYTVVLSSSAERALGIIEDNKQIGIVITDMMMPGIGGRGLIEKLREAKSRPKILIISGIKKLHEIVDLLDGGAEYFLPKPIDRKMLITYVERMNLAYEDRASAEKLSGASL